MVCDSIVKWLDNDSDYTLNCQFAEQGIVMLDVNKKDAKLKHLLGDLLGDLGRASRDKRH